MIRQFLLPAIALLLTVLSLWLILISVFLGLNFGKVSLEELLVFLSLGEGGVTGADTQVIVEFVLIAVLPPVLVMFLLAFNYKILFQKKATTALILFVTALLSSFFVSSVLETSASAEDSQAISGSALDSYSPENLPQEVNLIQIFVESLASDLKTSAELTNTPHLAIIDSMGPNTVSSAIPANDVGGTIGGIAASMCGIESLRGGFLDAESDNYLLGNLECKSDLLDSLGYQNVFFGAASGNFQSKSNFLKSHGFKVFEKQTWLKIGAPEQSAWGQTIHDDRLFSHGRSIAQSLLIQDQPFVLTGLTLDNHYPYYIPSSCDKSNLDKSKLERTYLCSAESVATLIDWYRNHTSAPTVIVVQGDHPPAMGISSNRDIFFAATCHGTADAELVAPKSVSDIAPFVLDTMSKCR